MRLYILLSLIRSFTFLSIFNLDFLYCCVVCISDSEKNYFTMRKNLKWWEKFTFRIKYVKAFFISSKTVRISLNDLLFYLSIMDVWRTKLCLFSKNYSVLYFMLCYLYKCPFFVILDATFAATVFPWIITYSVVF